MTRSLCLLFLVFSFCVVFVGSFTVKYQAPYVLNPPWPATYNMSKSTIFMPCNDQGYFDSNFAAKFGIASYDWSNAKALWTKAKPMNCEETLVMQAQQTKKVNPNTHVWVYRNIVKALPWFSTVRTKLEDPKYWGWFLHYKNASGNTASTNLYHDFGQTPGGDCGNGVECGEYLFDHRNDTLREWLINEYVVSQNGVLNPAIDGVFFDDNWSASGPAEEDPKCIEIIGLSKKDISDLTNAWQQTLEATYTALISHKAYSWQLITDTMASDNFTKNECTQWLQKNCGPNSPLLERPFVYSFTRPIPLTSVEQDVAIFLLTRGDYAWIGFGWSGCGGPWVRPPQVDIDYGVPTSDCKQLKTGTFTREYSKATVTMDCPNWAATIKMK